MKTTTITGPDGQTIVVREERSNPLLGCLAWLASLFLVGLLIVYPWLIIPTTALLLTAYLIHTRRSSKP